MLELSSRRALFAALGSARRVELAAYTLAGKRLIGALARAAERGAEVSVRLEAAPYARDAKRANALHEHNAAVAKVLRRHGVRVRLTHDREALFHLKAAIVDGALFLDDRNWPSGGSDTIVRSAARRDVRAAHAAIAGRAVRPGPLALRKDHALAAEARLIATSPGDRIDCQSETFSSSPVSSALLSAARSGKHVRLLIAAQELRGAGARGERATLRRLLGAGAQVRATSGDEKFCVTSSAAWLGSANATGGEPRSTDWGASSRQAAIVSALSNRFETAWEKAQSIGPASLRSGSEKLAGVRAGLGGDAFQRDAQHVG